MLLRQIFRTLDVPNEDTQVTIRRLNRKQQRKARDARQVAAITKLVAIGGQSAVKQLQDIDADPALRKQAEDEAAKDPFNTYDPDAVLYAGIVSWTHTEGEGDAKTLVPVTPETIDMLDDDEAEWLAKEIIALFNGEDTGKND